MMKTKRLRSTRMHFLSQFVKPVEPLSGIFVPVLCLFSMLA